MILIKFAPVEIEALYASDYMIIGGASIIKVAPEGIFPSPDQRLAINQRGEGASAAVWLPQAIHLGGSKFTEKARDISIARARKVDITTKTVDW